MRLQRKMGFYEKYIKRLLDIICSLLFIIVFCWLYAIIAVVVRIKMGSPIIFKQPRPGIIKHGKETIFDMYKFRSMTDAKDENGNFLPDDQRLPKFGAFLRSTSLDELPEVFCILRGDMSIVGPRPTVRQRVEEFPDGQEVRLSMSPGLTGLAQVSGNVLLSWPRRIEYDCQYVGEFNLLLDMKIILKTVLVVLFGEEKYISRDDLKNYRNPVYDMTHKSK